MTSNSGSHLFIFATVFFTVYSQVVMRWQVNNAGELPTDFSNKLVFVAQLLIKPWVISGILSTFLAGVSWMLAMTKFEISYAFPFMGLNYVLILLAGGILFNESITLARVFGVAIVIIGLIIVARN
jgi:multidrug transporter EmrE-like cation transporter